MSAFIQRYQLDMHIGEHGERLAYLDTFWSLVGHLHKLAETERELKKALAQQDLETFRRQVDVFDRPGSRHLLPTVRGVPCRTGSWQYREREGEILARIQRA